MTESKQNYFFTSQDLMSTGINKHKEARNSLFITAIKTTWAEKRINFPIAVL